MIGGYLGQRTTLGCLWHAIARGVRGHAPPVNIENLHSQRCIFLDFGDKIKGIQDRLLSGYDAKKKKNYDELEC